MEDLVAKIRLGGVVITLQRDRKIRRLRRVYTDAVSPNPDTLNQAELEDACDQAISATEDDLEIDGVQLEPWPEDN